MTQQQQNWRVLGGTRQFCCMWCLATRAVFLYLTELYKLLVLNLSTKLLKLCETLYVSTLDASEVTTAAYFWYDAGALHTLGKTANDIRTTLVVILYNFNIGCHMWPRAYHGASGYARNFLAGCYRLFFESLYDRRLINKLLVSDV